MEAAVVDVVDLVAIDPPEEDLTAVEVVITSLSKLINQQNINSLPLLSYYQRKKKKNLYLFFF